MTTKPDPVPQFLRDLIKNGLDLDSPHALTSDDILIQVNPLGQGRVRLDLPDLRRSFLWSSGRLYERSWMAERDPEPPSDQPAQADTALAPGELDPPQDQASAPEPPGPSDSATAEEPAEGDQASAEAPPPPPASTIGPAPEATPGLVHQLNYHGQTETLDAHKYRNRIVCACGNVRWVKNADLFQVSRCKPCLAQDRKTRRRVKPRDTAPSPAVIAPEAVES